MTRSDMVGWATGVADQGVARIEEKFEAAMKSLGDDRSDVALHKLFIAGLDAGVLEAGMLIMQISKLGKVMMPHDRTPD